MDVLYTNFDTIHECHSESSTHFVGHLSEDDPANEQTIKRMKEAGVVYVPEVTLQSGTILPNFWILEVY